MKRNDLQAKTWQAVGLVQWHQLVLLKQKEQNTLTENFICFSPNAEKSPC